MQSDFTVGLAQESTYGTPVTVSRFWEADASLKEKVTSAQGRGYRTGTRVARADRSVVVKRESSGDVELDAMSIGLGLLLKAFFGTSVVTQVPTTSVYQQNHTLAASDYLPSFTLQQGIPRLASATVDAYTYCGAQCTDLEISAKDGQIAQIKSSWMAKELKRDQALAPAVYPVGAELLTFVGASLAVGGTYTAPTATAPASIAGGLQIPIRDVSLKLKNNLDSEGFNLGGGGMRTRPGALKGAAEDVIGGELTAEYTDPALVDAYRNHTSLPLVLSFAGITPIGAGIVPLLQFAIPAVFLTGDVPVSNKGDVITVSHSFEGRTPASGEPIVAVYRSLDTAV